MKSSVENNTKSKEIYHNFQLSKNIPIDNRFLQTSLIKIDDDLPLNKRYPGLIFFVTDSNINGKVGNFFCFENDLTSYIPFFSISTNQEIKQLDVDEENYNYLNEPLGDAVNDNMAFPGSIVTIRPLGISYIFDGTDWLYFLGNYKVSTEAVYYSIPDNLKMPGRLVEIGTSPLVLKVIGVNLNLMPYSPDKFNVFVRNLNNGKNRLTHILNSTYISVFIRIYEIDNIEEENNQVIPARFEIVDENNIDIYCAMDNVTTEIMVKSNAINF